jgi:hypothetical protein
MSTDNLAGILDTATRHKERSDSRTSDAVINAHETLDQLIHEVAHNGRVTALNEAIAKIRELADEWSKTGADLVACEGDITLATGRTLQNNAEQLKELAFALLSSVDGS